MCECAWVAAPATKPAMGGDRIDSKPRSYQQTHHRHRKDHLRLREMRHDETTQGHGERSDNKPQRWTYDELVALLDWQIESLTEIRAELRGTMLRVLDWTPGVSAGMDVAVSGGRVAGPRGAA